MKNLYILVICMCMTSFSYSQFSSNFDEGTLEGFTNSDGGTEQLTVEEIGGVHFLQKICDGTNSAVGEMMIINTEDYIGNYFYDPTGNGEIMRGLDEIYMKNENDFDIHLRYGFTGSNGYKVVTTAPIVIPALSDWNMYNQYFYLSFPTIENLSIINNVDGIPYLEVFNHIHELFEDVVEFRIFHNEVASFEPQVVDGTLQIDEIYSIELLNASENLFSNLELYPNPVISNLTVVLPRINEATIEFYNVLGDKVLSQQLVTIQSRIDLSDLQSGMYLVKITSEEETVTKKIVKN